MPPAERVRFRSRSLLSYVPENPDLSPYVFVGDVIRKRTNATLQSAWMLQDSRQLLPRAEVANPR
jgi:hypothetical protein